MDTLNGQFLKIYKGPCEELPTQTLLKINKSFEESINKKLSLISTLIKGFLIFSALEKGITFGIWGNTVVFFITYYF